MVQEIERYAEVIDQLKSEVNGLKETLKHRTMPKIKSVVTENKKTGKKNSDDYFTKSLQTEDVCAALNSFVQNHSTLLLSNPTLSLLGLDEKPTQPNITPTPVVPVEVIVTPLPEKPIIPTTTATTTITTTVTPPAPTNTDNNWTFNDTVRFFNA